MYPYESTNGKLIIGGIPADELVEQFGSPLYVYDEQIIRERFRTLNECIGYPHKRIHFAMKANSNPHVLNILREEGCYIDAVSIGEIFIALKCGYEPERILFTGINLSMDDIYYARENGVRLNIGSLFTLEKYGKQYPGTEISLRINPNMGAGHHSHVITGGEESKFGIFEDDIPQARSIMEHYGLKLMGIQCHIGSGVMEEQKYMEVMDIILRLGGHFDDLEFVDFGGGIGVAYRPEQKDFDLKGFGKDASAKMEAFSAKINHPVTFALEPGRFLIAEAGYFLTTVQDIKHTPKYKFIGVNSGFNSLVRPTMYGSYHHILNASDMNAEPEQVVVAGYICESGDLFTRNMEGPEARPIPKVKEGDVLVVLTAGAYAFAMASQYNSHPLPAEVIVNDGKAFLSREAETFEDLIGKVVW